MSVFTDRNIGASSDRENDRLLKGISAGVIELVDNRGWSVHKREHP